MRKFFLLSIVVLLSMAADVKAQKIEQVKERLSIHETGENGRSARIEIYESGNTGGVIRRGEAAATLQTANGFRIVIFFDNGSTARSEAEKIKASFSSVYPDVSCDIRYENPYFKVLAGNCITSEEAVILLGRIRSSYPEAYIMREDIQIQNFVSPKRQEIRRLDDDSDELKESDSEI